MARGPHHTTHLLSAPLVGFPQIEGLGGQFAPRRCSGSWRPVLIFPAWLCALRQPPTLSEPQPAGWPGYSLRMGLTQTVLEGSVMHRCGEHASTLSPAPGLTLSCPTCWLCILRPVSKPLWASILLMSGGMDTSCLIRSQAPESK